MIDSDAAHVLVANLGFLLVPGPPLDHGAAYLLIAIRPKPTLAHFDPERISYWGFAKERACGQAAHAQQVELTWPLKPINDRFSWGTIAITDRLGALNRFVTFGGDLAVSRDKEVHAALFRSGAPILSVGGHSGPPDPLAAQIAGFQATLRGAAGYDSPVHDLAERLDPVALYAAFVIRALKLYRRVEGSASGSLHLVSLLDSEMRRLDARQPLALKAGRELAALIDTAAEIALAAQKGP